MTGHTCVVDNFKIVVIGDNVIGIGSGGRRVGLPMGVAHHGRDAVSFDGFDRGRSVGFPQVWPLTQFST